MGFLSRLKNIFRNDIGIDLGATTTVVTMPDRGTLLDEPSVLAILAGDNKVLATGNEARNMLRRSPVPEACRPVEDDVILDFDMTAAMLVEFLQRVNGRRGIRRPRVLVAVPSGIRETRACQVGDVARRAGARDVYLVERLMAISLGISPNPESHSTYMVVNIGATTTEAAVVFMGRITHPCHFTADCDAIQQAIVRWVQCTHGLLIGERTAERVRTEIGTAYPCGGPLATEIKGRDLMSGMPKTIPLNSDEIREAIRAPLDGIVEVARKAMERSADLLLRDGSGGDAILTGVGSQLPGLDALLAAETGMRVTLDPGSPSAVARGLHAMLEDEDLLSHVAHIAPRSHRSHPSRTPSGGRKRGRTRPSLPSLTGSFLGGKRAETRPWDSP